MARYFWLIFFLVFLLPDTWLMYAQHSATLPSLYPVSVRQYGVAEGLPDPCVALARVYDNGRLMMISCGHVRSTHNLSVYTFDGQKSWPVEFNFTQGPIGVHSRFLGIDKNGIVYGFKYNDRYLNNSTTTTFFTFDPATSNTTLLTFGLGQKYTGILEHALLTDEGYFLLTRNATNGECEIFNYKNDSLTSIIKFHDANLIEQLDLRFYSPLYLAITSTDFWIGHTTRSILRISRNKTEIKTYPLPVLDKTGKTYPISRMLVSPKNDILFYAEFHNRLFKWDSRTDKIIADVYLPTGWKHTDVLRILMSSDDVGNLLIAHQHNDRSLSGLLVDTESNYFNYSPVIARLNTVRMLGDLEANWNSRDFKKELIAPGYDFYCFEVSATQPIKSFPTISGTRALIELEPGILLARPFGVLSVHDGSWTQHPDLSDAFGDPVSDIQYDKNGRIWGIGNKQILCYTPKDHQWKAYDLPSPLERFAFLDNTHILYITSTTQLYTLDLTSGISTLLTQKTINGFINQLFIGSDGTPWIASSVGLFKIDLAKKVFDQVDIKDGLADNRIIRIHEDKKGRLWLGTFLNGMQIYDPASGTLHIINESKGFSNNTVVSILEDDDGNIWAGTFNGITILNQEGEILGHVYQDDGLIDNESNRWSSYKSPDGHLYFGSMSGISYIDPKMLIRQMQSYSPPKIYLTKLIAGNGDAKEWSTPSTLNLDVQNLTVELPASNRNLYLGFALSNYSASDKRTFAYKIEGVDEDWNYIGSQNEVSINRLPAGNYRILVTGADHHGKKTVDPISIQVQAHEFFYLQWWFYVLCLIPFAGGALLYQYRQRQENKRLETEVIKRTETIQQQADQLREMDAMKTKLYTNITHEFRTPLTIIEGMADEMPTDPMAPEMIKRNSRNLLHLVNQMLDLSKLESGDMPLQYVQHDIISLLKYIVETYQSLANSKSIHFHFLTEESSVVMDFDPEKVRQILSNLLANAIKFTPAGGSVYLQADVVKHFSRTKNIPASPHLVLKVRDTGIGIAEDQLPHIFKRFYQVDSGPVQTGEGTGIGLTLVSELVQLMKGDIQVTSRPGQGTTFTVALPMTNTAARLENEDLLVGFNFLRKNTSTPEILTDVDQVENGDDLPIILLVEDNVDVVYYLMSCLRDTYRIETARDGQEGIDKALAVVPDIIVSDVMMPVKDGFELVHTLKNDLRTSHIPILLLTAKADMDSKLTGLRKVADAYLAKPFVKEELLLQLKNLVDHQRKLQQRYATPQPSPSEDPELHAEDAFMTRFREYVEKNIDNEDLDIHDLCRAMSISRAQLYRKIKALTGKSASLLIRSIRLDRARILLRNPEYNVTQVAYEVGFRYPEYFSRAFSEEYGMSPRQWADQHQAG